jgi:carboxypeptidase Taq
MKQRLTELIGRLREVNDLESAAALLNWDQTTYMPPRGAEARGRQKATLLGLAHEKFTDPAIGRLLEELSPLVAGLPEESFEASLVRETRRAYDRATRVPTRFLAELSEHTSRTYQAWTKARPANDFASLAPLLERTVDLSRQYADFFPGYDHPADPHIDDSDYGMKASSVRAIFEELRKELAPIAKAILARAPADDRCLKQRYPIGAQLAFGSAIVKDFGFDFERGRQDHSPHPFMTKFGLNDVRITTRVDEHDLSSALFSSLHECGHALYELGVDPALEGTPLGGGASSGVHESQSRTWENIVGRSLPFWRGRYPALQRAFPEQLGKVSLETFYRAINKVERSLVRTEADEVTYNLHVILRFDLELQLLEGSLGVRDLPAAWKARYETDLGFSAPDDRDGVLQDVHWYAGRVGGMFQGYTLGNLLSAQFYEKAVAEVPSIPAAIEAGEFGPLHGWLRENLYRHGAKFTAPELIRRVTGGGVEVAPYVRYLRAKFGEIYSL